MLITGDAHWQQDSLLHLRNHRCMLIKAPSQPHMWMLSQQVCFLAHNTSYIHIHVPRAGLTAAMIPRSVTMALALPIAHQLHASAGITALGVMLTGQSFGALLPRLLIRNITCISSSRVVGGQGAGGGWWVEASSLHAYQHRTVRNSTDVLNLLCCLDTVDHGPGQIASGRLHIRLFGTLSHSHTCYL